VKVQVVHGLPRVGAMVGEQAISAVRDAPLLRQAMSDRHDLGQHVARTGADVCYALHMLSRHDQDVSRGQRGDIVEGYNMLTFHKERRAHFAGYNPAENAI
jgi:hypothetical protein